MKNKELVKELVNHMQQAIGYIETANRLFGKEPQTDFTRKLEEISDKAQQHLQGESEKCLIHNGPQFWTITADGQTIRFTGLHLAELLREKYSALDYHVEFLNDPLNRYTEHLY